MAKAKQSKKQKGQQPQLLPFFAPVILIALGLLIYGQSLSFGLLWDDLSIHFDSNPGFVYFDWSSLVDFWAEPYAGMYIPVFYTTMGTLKLIASAIGSPDSFPQAAHFMSVTLHILNTFLVSAVLRRLVKTHVPILVGGALFLVHPLQVEVVAWVSEIRALLGFGFGCAGLLVLLRAEQRLLLVALANVLFILALLSKPAAIVFVGFAILFAGVESPRLIVRTLVRVSPSILAVVAVSAITLSVQNTDATTAWFQRPAVASFALGFYLFKLLWPLDLAACYGFRPDRLASSWYFYPSLAIAITYTFAIVWSWKRERMVALGMLIVVAGFAPVSGMIPFAFQDWSTVADRYFYYSMLGVALLVAIGMQKWFLQPVKLGAGVLLIALAGLSTWHQVPQWKDGKTLWNHTISICDDCGPAYSNRGLALSHAERFDAAIRDFKRAIDLYPSYAPAHYNLGLAYFRQNRDVATVLESYSKAIEHDPTYVQALINRANIYKTEGRYEEAMADFDAALQVQPNYARTYLNRGVLNEVRGAYTESLADYEKAATLLDTYDKAFSNWGNLLLNLGKYDEAIVKFDRAIEIEPRVAKYYCLRGLTYRQMNRESEAKTDIEKAKFLQPDSCPKG